MISVGIFINGTLIIRCNAVNKKLRNEKGETKYVTDEGKVIWHRRELGATPLAQKMLETLDKKPAS